MCLCACACVFVCAFVGVYMCKCVACVGAVFQMRVDVYLIWAIACECV